MLQVNNISFTYPSQKSTLINLHFKVKKGEHLCLMGESGCGKSTLLKIIYGLLDIDEGSIFWDDFKVLGPSKNLIPGVPFFKYLAQDFDLMPFTSVSENINKFLSRFYPKEAQKKTNELLKVLDMIDFADTKVKNLSGGQQQRVAIAQVLAEEPKLLLLDEPFSQIDNFKKNTLRRKLFKYLKLKNITCIVATHDVNDALSFADKLIVINDHKIIVNNTPSQIYKKPSNKYVASLFDDVNEVFINGEKSLLYPHQIKVVKKSNFFAIVLNSYFKGSYWLIEARFNKQIIYFKHMEDILINTEINLSLK